VEAGAVSGGECGKVQAAAAGGPASERAAAMSFVSLERVVRRHGEAFELRIERLAVPRGELFCLLGPTGAGKSTLLRTLAGLEPPDAGTVSVDGQRLSGEGWPLPLLRRVTLVFQRPILLSGSVRANVEYGLKLRRRRDGSDRADEWLQRLGLTSLAQQSASTLSGGQVQLVALARALALEPQLLLLDEPTANLDPAHVALVERAIQAEHRRRKMTVVWATHNLFQARRVAERVGLLLAGQLIEVAPVERFFSEPADPRAADFVQGKMIY